MEEEIKLRTFLATAFASHDPSLIILWLRTGLSADPPGPGGGAVPRTTLANIIPVPGLPVGLKPKGRGGDVLAGAAGKDIFSLPLDSKMCRHEVHCLNRNRRYFATMMKAGLSRKWTWRSWGRDTKASTDNIFDPLDQAESRGAQHFAVPRARESSLRVCKQF